MFLILVDMQKGVFFALYLTFFTTFQFIRCFMLWGCLLFFVERVVKSVKSRIFYCSKLVIIEQILTTPL